MMPELPDDDRRESIINYYRAQLIRADSREGKRFWWTLMAREINKRGVSSRGPSVDEAHQ